MGDLLEIFFCLVGVVLISQLSVLFKSLMILCTWFSTVVAEIITTLGEIRVIHTVLPLYSNPCTLH